MVRRPRTRLVKGRKAKRWPKCGKLVGNRQRCERCRRPQQPL